MSEQPKPPAEPAASAPKQGPKLVLKPTKASPFWRPIQKLRFKLHIAPSVETEMLAQMIIRNQLQMMQLLKNQRLANTNFENIAAFIDLTNDNAIRIDKNIKGIDARVAALERALGKGESEDGSYVQ